MSYPNAPQPPVKNESNSGQSDQLMCVLSHVLAIFTGFIGPLVIYLATENPNVKQHSRESLNWQISLMIYYLGSFVLAFVFIGFLFLFVLPFINIVFCIIAAIKASEGRVWRYPLTFRILGDS